MGDTTPASVLIPFQDATDDMRKKTREVDNFMKSFRKEMINRLRWKRNVGSYNHHQFRMLKTGMIQRLYGGKWHNWFDGSKGGLTPWIGMQHGFPSRNNGTLIGSYRSALRYRNQNTDRVAIDMVVCPTRMPDPKDPKNTEKHVAVSQRYINGVFNRGNGYRKIAGQNSLNLDHPIQKWMMHPSPKHRHMWNSIVWVRFVTRRQSDGKYNTKTFKDVLNHPSQHTFFQANKLEFLLNS